MNDPYVLAPGLAPTPFSAADIRGGCPNGHTLHVRATSPEGVAEYMHRFEDGDAQNVTITNGCDEGAERVRLRWRDLQAHAAFPVELTTIDDETITTPLGELKCRRYHVAAETPMTYWFSLAHPGMPIRYTDGTTLTEVTAISR